MSEGHVPSRSGLSRSWAVIALVYAAFFSWYTSFGGPLTDEEIAHYSAILEAEAEHNPNALAWVEFMESDTGNSFAMWNAVDMADTPKALEGIEPGESAQDTVDRYAEPFFARSLRHASHPVMGGMAANRALDNWGIDDAEVWDNALLVRYRSRRDMMEILEHVTASGENIHDFKVAALEKTIAFPIDPWFHPGDPRLLLALLLLPVGLVAQMRRNARP